MSKLKLAVALGLGAVIGAVVSAVFKDKISAFVDDVLARAEALNPVLGGQRDDTR